MKQVLLYSSLNVSITIEKSDLQKKFYSLEVFNIGPDCNIFIFSPLNFQQYLIFFWSKLDKIFIILLSL